jgi:hypothetical protein
MGRGDKITRAQLEVLRILERDPRPHETTTSTRSSYEDQPDYVNGTTAAALVRRGWAASRGWPSLVTLTDKGREVLAAHENRGRQERL